LRKSEYRKRQRDNAENLTQNFKELELNDYWLHQIFASLQIDLMHHQEEEVNRKGKDQKINTFIAPPIFEAGVYHIQTLK